MSSGRRTSKSATGQEADDDHGGAERDPAGAPAVARDRELADQRHRGEPEHLRDVDDRGRGSAAGNEPAVQARIDAELERRRPVHARDAEEQIEHRERRGERQKQQRAAADEHREREHEARAAPVEH
jgi:hypothetical protein